MQENLVAILHQRNRELTILNNIAEALNRSIDLEEALQAALSKAAELLDLKTGWVWLVREDTGDTYLAAAQNLPRGLATAPELMQGTCYCLDTYQEGDLEGAANVNVILCSRLKKLVDGTDGLRYHASIPLYAHGKSLGVLNLASTDWRELTSDDLRLLYTVGDLLGIAIERARLYADSIEFGAVAERNRLAREIHDTLAQGLSGIALQLEAAEALLEAQVEPNRVLRNVSQALNLTRTSLEEARRSVLDLRPAPLEGRSLPVALQELVKSLPEKKGLEIKIEIHGSPKPISTRMETSLYRLAQEAITNIIRHAAATKANVQLIYSLESIQLFIEDNGRGFLPENAQEGKFGLIGMNERVKMMRGTLAIESSPGKGTRIEITLPLAKGINADWKPA